jgi:predicted unusual protein kinase regulating ubiquinone biosynthesis (AarF/ABC1/UbiB family)
VSDQPSVDKLPRGFRRALSTARLSGRLGVKAAGRMLFKKSGPRDEDEQAAIAAARQLVAKMGNLKGLVMKAGQIASYMPGAMPPAAAAILAELQSQSAPMAWPQIEAVLRAELGDARFDSIEERPFAAASIGQVHRAVLRGAPVAVKIQYPGIEDAIRNDLRMVGVIARLSSIGSPLDGAGLAGELRDRLVEECDYVHEAANQRLFQRLLAHMPGASAPDVIDDRTTRRVLTTALVERAPLADIAASGSQAVRDRAGQIIFRACFELLWQRAIYNADPHPGNYLVAPDGDVTFLDFGCVRRFEPDMIRTWKQLARAILADDQPTMRERFRELGFVGKDKGFDWDYQWNALRFMYTPFLERDFRFTPEFVTKTFGIMMFDNPNRMKIAMPPAWLFLNRLQWGLNAVLAQLHAGGPWRVTIDELLDGELEPA